MDGVEIIDMWDWMDFARTNYFIFATTMYESVLAWILYVRPFVKNGTILTVYKVLTGVPVHPVRSVHTYTANTAAIIMGITTTTFRNDEEVRHSQHGVHNTHGAPRKHAQLEFE